MKNALRTLSLLALITSFSLFAEEEESRRIVGEHEDPRIDKIAENRYLESAEEEDEEEVDLAFALPTEKGLRADLYYPEECHWLVAKSVLGNTLEIEDSSVWSIRSSDRWKIADWITANTDYDSRVEHPDPIFITQNRSWFSQYKYKMINQASNDVIEVNLELGPYRNNEFAHSLYDISFFQDIVTLDDGTVWKISASDRYILDNWDYSHGIIIGINSGWQQHYSKILINVEAGTFVRAELY